MTMVESGLPFPVVTGVSATKRLFGHRSRPSVYRSKSDDKLPSLLGKRLRPSNLVAVLLFAMGVLSILLNIKMWIGEDRLHQHGAVDSVPFSVQATLQSPFSSLKHLVVVPGHAIFKGSDASHPLVDDQWILEPYQRGGTVKSLVGHIVKGAEIAIKDPEALLVFSGGQTRKGADLTEATSYARLASVGNIYQRFMPHADGEIPTNYFTRVTTEEFALDSMTNLLFSIARFKEFTGNYPEKITVIGFEMKRKRFEQIHRLALRWPQTMFHYVGLEHPDPGGVAHEGERTNGWEPFSKDLYGCHGTLLSKKKQRNPYRRFHPYHNSAPELEGLFEYCPGDNTLYPEALPWAPALETQVTNKALPL